MGRDSSSSIAKTCVCAAALAFWGCQPQVADGVPPPEVEIPSGTGDDAPEPAPKLSARCSEELNHWRQRYERENHHDILYNLGVTQVRCGHLEGAETSFKKVVAIEDDHARAQLQLALVTYERRNATRAATAERIQEAIRAASFRLPMGLLHLALLQMQRNQGDDASQAKLNIQRAIAVSADAPEPFAVLAQYTVWQAQERAKQGLADAGLLELARRIAAIALERHPDFGPLHHAHGLALWSLGRADEAEIAFTRARQAAATPRVERLPSEKQAALAHAELAKYNDGGRATCDAGPGPACDAFAPVLERAATLFAKASQPAKAIAVRKLLTNPSKGLSHTPEAVAALLALAGDYERLGIFDIAAAYYAKFANTAPKLQDARDALAKAIELYTLLGNDRDATTHTRTFRRLYPHVKLHLARPSPVQPAPGPRPKMWKGRQMLPPLLLPVR